MVVAPAGDKPPTSAEAGPLVGRSAELELAVGALSAPASRLVTLTGPPGVGKTRLAMAVAERSADRFPDGVAWVDVSEVDTLELATVKVGRALGLEGRQWPDLASGVATRLADAAMLLVLDGCDRVPELRQVVAELVAAAARTRVLATSDQRLQLAVERELPVPPLAMPDPSTLSDIARLAATPAVEMLVSQARLARPSFHVDERNAQSVARICTRLDGMPLALEIAGARLTDFEPGELAVRLRNREFLLGSRSPSDTVRHRTLRTAIDWSHDLLSDQERLVFRRVSIFPAQWTVSAAEQVAGEPDMDMLAVTAMLTEKHLITPVTRVDGIGQFQMLDSLREYGREQLMSHGEEEQTRARHASYFSDLAAEAEAGFGTSDEAVWQEWVRLEHGNLRAALRYCRVHDDLAAGLPLAAAIGWYWYLVGYLVEGQRDVDAVLAAADAAKADPLPGDRLAGALLVGGILAAGTGRLGRAGDLLRRSLALSEQVGDLRRGAIAHAFLGHVALRERRYDDAATEYRTAAAIFEQLDNPRGTAWSRHDLGVLALECGRLDEAATFLGQAREWFAAVGDSWALGWTLWSLSRVATRKGDEATARAMLAQALERYMSVDNWRGIADCLADVAIMADVAIIAGDRGSCEVCLKLLAAAKQLRGTVGPPDRLDDFPDLTAVYERARHTLGVTAAQQAERAGSTMPLSAATRLALEVIRPSHPTPGASPLTQRQRQIATLVAQGQTNRRIARNLGIAEKTVEVHLSNMMERLGVRSRAEVAAHAVTTLLNQRDGE
jgi:predicted ATPase/DNA-binding CsgD family transcriptional regulator